MGSTDEDGLSPAAAACVQQPHVLRANDRVFLGKDECAFDHVLEFANISRPPVPSQQLQCLRRELRRGRAQGKFFEKVIGQRRDVFQPVLERSNVQRESAETLVQIFAEFSFPHPCQQVRVGRGDDAGIHPHHL